MALIDGKVCFYDLSLVNGSLSGVTLNTNECLKSGADALSNYQANFNVNHINGLAAMVPALVKTDNITITHGNTLLSIESLKDENPLRSTELSWYKTADNNIIPKQSIHLIVAKNGILTYFNDDIGTYKVVTTETNVTKQKALDSAMPIIEAFAEESGRRVEAINAEFGYVADYNSTRGDSFLIYPEWTIMASFNVIPSDDIDGYAVSIWADTGEIYEQCIQGTYKGFENTSNTLFIQPYFVILALTIGVTPIGILAYAKSKKKLKINRLSRKTGGLIVILALITSLCAVQPVFASPASIFGCLGGVSLNERLAIEAISDDLAEWTDNAGYDTINYCGDDTTEANYIYAAYDRGASGSLVHHVGHGDENPYSIREANGEYVSASTIYDGSYSLSIGHHKVAIIWSCFSGYPKTEMCRAWLHDVSTLSDDGYGDSDYSGQAYIGWHGVAPYLTSEIYSQSSAGNRFLRAFYDAALYHGYNINMALDYAASQVWSGNTFSSCCFRTGIYQFAMPPFNGEHIEVYGQGTLHLGYTPYCSGIEEWRYGYSIAAVDNPSGLTGVQDNGQFVHLHAGDQYDYAWVTGEMNAEASGEVYLAGYSGSGYTSHIIVYVSEDYYNWEPICDGYILDTHLPYIHCGYSSGFRYIGIAVEDTIGYSACMWIDGVHVQTTA